MRVCQSPISLRVTKFEKKLPETELQVLSLRQVKDQLPVVKGATVSTDPHIPPDSCHPVDPMDEDQDDVEEDEGVGSTHPLTRRS